MATKMSKQVLYCNSNNYSNVRSYQLATNMAQIYPFLTLDHMLFLFLLDNEEIRFNKTSIKVPVETKNDPIAHLIQRFTKNNYKRSYVK